MKRIVVSKEDVIEWYNDMLNECNGEMFGHCASTILEEVDPIQYKCGLNDYYDSICEECYCEEME